MGQSVAWVNNTNSKEMMLTCESTRRSVISSIYTTDIESLGQKTGGAVNNHFEKELSGASRLVPVLRNTATTSL